MIAIDILEWPGVSVPFLTSFVASLVLTFIVIPYGKRRPVGKPLSWGEGMLAGTYAFGVMFLAFGVVPNAWIDHADRELGWSKDKIIYGPGGILKPQVEPAAGTRSRSSTRRCATSSSCSSTPSTSA